VRLIIARKREGNFRVRHLELKLCRDVELVQRRGVSERITFEKGWNLQSGELKLCVLTVFRLRINCKIKGLAVFRIFIMRKKMNIQRGD
jgi:hypothetical protein